MIFFTNKRMPSFLIVAVVGISVFAYMVYTRIFYYTGHDFAPFPLRTYTSCQRIDIPERIWLHRVNSIERAEYFLHEYSGFEIDIYYDPARDIFNVDHDNRDFNTSLYDMFACLSKKGEKSFWVWLDFKNLDKSNMDKALNRLEFLAMKFSVPRNHIIVESSSIEDLSVFHQASYITSFYFIPPPKEDFFNRMEKLRNRFYTSGVVAVSSDLKYHDLVEKAFPNVPWLFWDLKSYTKRNVVKFVASRIRRHILLKEQNIKVLLVKDDYLRR